MDCFRCGAVNVDADHFRECRQQRAHPRLVCPRCQGMNVTRTGRTCICRRPFPELWHCRECQADYHED